MKANIFARWGLNIHHFSESERKAQATAQQITSTAKTILQSKAALTVEALTPHGLEIGTAALVVVTEFADLLNSPVIGNSLDAIEGLLGRFGAQLTMELHGREHATIGDYVIVFESLFHLGKK